MNYYPHHIGDYAAATRGLSLAEHGAYRTMLDQYYLDEQPLPAAPEALCRTVGARGEEERAAVLIIALNYFEERDGLLHHKRCDEEIAQYQSNVERCRNNGKKGGRPRMFGDVPRETKPTANPGLTQGKPSPNPTLTQGKANQEPITNNQEKEKTFCTPSATKNGSASPNRAGLSASGSSRHPTAPPPVHPRDRPGPQARVITQAGARTPAVGGFPGGSPQPAAAQAVNNSDEGPPGDATAQAGGSSADVPTPTSPPAPVSKSKTVNDHEDLPPEKPIRRTYMPRDFTISERVRDWAQRKGHDRLEQRFECFTSYAIRRAVRYADWDTALMTSIRDDWAKLNSTPVSYLGEGDVL